MEPLKWKTRSGQLADALDIAPGRIDEIQKEASTMLGKQLPLIEVIDHMRSFCQTDEEYTAFIFSLGYTDGYTEAKFKNYL